MTWCKPAFWEWRTDRRCHADRRGAMHHALFEPLNLADQSPPRIPQPRCHDRYRKSQGHTRCVLISESAFVAATRATFKKQGRLPNVYPLPLKCPTINYPCGRTPSPNNPRNGSSLTTKKRYVYSKNNLAATLNDWTTSHLTSIMPNAPRFYKQFLVPRYFFHIL